MNFSIVRQIKHFPLITETQLAPLKLQSIDQNLNEIDLSELKQNLHWFEASTTPKLDIWKFHSKKIPNLPINEND